MKKATERIPTAAYCRVSTALELQEGSFETQKAYYERYIAADPTLELVGVYGDLGRSGRTMRHRSELMRMLEDCAKGKIRRILTKSISRFSRSMADCVAAIRTLNAMGVSVYFEKEAIDTAGMNGELLLCILSGVAEEESHSIGHNLRWTHEKANAEGKPVFKAAYGYEKINGEWQIEPKAARRVLYAFELAAEGGHYREILDGLNQMETAEGTGVVWREKRLRNLLSNVAYMGDCLTNQYYISTENGKHERKNHGERDRFYIEAHHAPLVSRAIFVRVARLRASRLLHSNRKRYDQAELQLLHDQSWRTA